MRSRRISMKTLHRSFLSSSLAFDQSFWFFLVNGFRFFPLFRTSIRYAEALVSQNSWTRLSHKISATSMRFDGASLGVDQLAFLKLYFIRLVKDSSVLLSKFKRKTKVLFDSIKCSYKKPNRSPLSLKCNGRSV